MLTLFRGGTVVWLSVEDAASIGVADNDWVEVCNRNGVLACRAVVSPRMPQGVCYMYHAKDRHVNVPRTELNGKRGGTDNSLTRIMLKPTPHDRRLRAALLRLQLLRLPTGTQRDEVVVVRRRAEQKVTY